MNTYYMYYEAKNNVFLYNERIKAKSINDNRRISTGCDL